MYIHVYIKPVIQYGVLISGAIENISIPEKSNVYYFGTPEYDTVTQAMNINKIYSVCKLQLYEVFKLLVKN